jgi:hypothetical protein
MDDLLILGTNPTNLGEYETPITEWLQANRNQSLNHQKTKLVSLKQTGIIYLGFYLKQIESQKEPLLMQPTTKKKWSLVKALRHLENHSDQLPNHYHPLAKSSIRRPPHSISSVNSHLGLIKHSRCYEFRRTSLDKTINRTANLSFSKDGEVQIQPTLKIRGEFHSIRWK